MDGGELAERALDLDPSLVVVLMAAPDDAETRELLSGYHDLPLLWKPLALPELARKVHDLVSAPRAIVRVLAAGVDALPIPPADRRTATRSECGRSG